MTLEERLLANIEYDTNGGCWLWSGAMDRKGYAKFGYDGLNQTASRLAYEVWVGPIPPDKPLVCHHCDTPACIRPDHLFAGTAKDNAVDMVRKGRDRWSK